MHSDDLAGSFEVEVILQRLTIEFLKKRGYYAVQILPKCSLPFKVLSRQTKQCGARYRTVGSF